MWIWIYCRGKQMDKGKLYLIPTPVSDGSPREILAPQTLAVLNSLDFFIVEEIRTARRFLVRAGIEKPIDSLTFLIYNEHHAGTPPEEFLQPVLDGRDAGLLSEAGAPCVADPGGMIVAAAHRKGIRVVPLSGPSSLLLALMASGLNGQQFVFHGYLPADKPAREQKLRDLESRARRTSETQIFIETPYRNHQLFESILATCKGDTLLCLAIDISGTDESILTLPVGSWKNKRPDLHKKPAIFLLNYL